MSELNPIVDHSIYEKRMSMSLLDKAFFADKISDSDLVVDFGCADGVLLRFLKGCFPDMAVLGYDVDTTMAKHSVDNALIYTNWEAVMKEVKKAKKATLNLSSVIHEVFHYCSRGDIDLFWEQVFNSGFAYIVVRDMVPSRCIDRQSNINDIKKVYHKFLHTKALTDFEGVWGSVEGNRQLLHFLLKYKYLEPNWSREVRENYLPITREDLLAKIPDDYDVLFHEHFILPYILQTVKDDVGIELKDPTHMKLILKRNV